MTIYYILTLLIILIAGTSLANRNELIKRQLQLAADLAERSNTLDWVLRHYQLHLFDPYLDFPGYPEKRCYHCHYPIGENHDPTCPWMLLRPVTAKLYPPVSLSK